MQNVTNHKPFGLVLTYANEEIGRVVLILEYTVWDVYHPYPIIFTFAILFLRPFNVNELIDIIPGLPYPGLFPFTVIFTFPVIFTYPTKALMRKSAYFFKSNNNDKQKLSGLNDS